MRVIHPKIFEYMVGNEVFVRHKDLRCDGVCYVTPAGKEEQSFCSQYVIQYRFATKERTELCDDDNS